MALTRGKIIKANNEEPDEVEKAISQVSFFNFKLLYVFLLKALLDLEVNSDLKASLRELHITAAKEVAELCHYTQAAHSMRRSAIWSLAVGIHSDAINKQLCKTKNVGFTILVHLWI